MVNATSIGVRHIIVVGERFLCTTVSDALVDELARTSPIDPAPLANGIHTVETRNR